MGSAQTLNQAVKQHQAGNLREAERLYRQILQVEPRHAEALHLLGVIAHQVGRHDLAVEYIRSALRERPHFAEAHCNLGVVLRAQGRLEDAVACFRQAVHHRPDYAEAYNNLGTALHDQGKLNEAAASFQQALRFSPNFAEAHGNLGGILAVLGKPAEAAASCERALRLQPDHVAAHNNLGIALKDQGKFEEAIAHYEQALRLKPDFADGYSNRGVALTELGRIDEAIASVREALRWQPKHAEALWQSAILLAGKLPAADRALLEQRLAEPGLSEADRTKLLFGLALVCDARGEYEQAAAQLRQANALTLTLHRRQGEGYDLDGNARFVENLLATFTPEFFERVRGFGLETERPVFVFGLPRSGTTLTQQILAAHSQVYGAGELVLGREDISAVGSQPTTQSFFAALPGLRRDVVQRVAQRHLDCLRTLHATAERVVDKYPDNYLCLGLLAVLFPRAKFIHCRRDLRDVAVSCWMTRFRHNPWTNNPDHIVARFRQYQRVMEHWRTVLPVPVLDVQYEETVADLPGVARRLVEWCGLDWEPACLAFDKVKHPVRTASVIQVRQPVYTRSVARWRNYEQDLGTLFAALTPLQERESSRQPEPFESYVVPDSPIRSATQSLSVDEAAVS